MTLEGIDNSVFNRADPNPSGLSFVISRATYGTNPDRRFDQHSSYAIRSGLVSGAYHFGVAGNISGQVDAFLAVAEPLKFLALDLEYNGENTMTNNEASVFIAAIHSHGLKIGLYHSQSGFPHLGQDWDWVARWRTTPPASWRFWQYAGTPLDRDKFNGTLAQLRALAGLVTPAHWGASVHPVYGTRGYPSYRYFNVFTVKNGSIATVETARTGGFSATCTAPSPPLSWAGHPKQSLVQLTSGSRAGEWIRSAYAKEL